MLIGMPAFRRARTAAGVVVVGSANADFATHVERRPQAGETVMAASSYQRAGGKGANQAAAAARAGAAVWFVGAVGDDQLGRAQLDALRQVSVDVSHVLINAEAPTGAAFITVTPDGENSIVVASGANALLHADEAVARLSALPAPAVVLIQTEIPVPTVDAVARWCAADGVRLVLNNGPFRQLDASTLQVADPLVLNEHEAHLFLAATETLHDPVDAVAGDPEDGVDPPVREALDQRFACDLLAHRLTLPPWGSGIGTRSQTYGLGRPGLIRLYPKNWR